MSFQIETEWVNQYRANIEIQYQQMGSRLRPTVRVETQNGEFGYYDRIGPTTAQKKTSRHSDTPLISTTHDRRQCSIVDYEWADLIDEQDKVRLIADPTSNYVQNAVFALGRAQDDEIIGAFNATAKSGKAGATSVSFPSASQVAVDYVETGSNTNSNLTIGKLRKVLQLLQSTEAIMDGEMVTAAVTSAQIQSLLRTTEVTNIQYNTVRALAEGAIDTFLGFKFVRTERLTTDTNSYRKCYFYPQSGMLLAMGSDITVDVGVRRDKSLAVQCYVKGTFGATRLWEAKVIEVKCDETK